MSVRQETEWGNAYYLQYKKSFLQIRKRKVYQDKWIQDLELTFHKRNIYS